MEIFLNSVDYNGNALEIVTKRYVGDKYDVIEALMKASFLDNKDKFGSILQAVKIRDTDNLTIGEKRRISKYDTELANLENNSENNRIIENNFVSLQESETKNVGEGSVGVESKTTDQVYLDNAKKAFIEGKINAFTMTENELYLNTNGVRVINGFKDNGNMDVFEASKVELTKDEKRELKQIEADREFGDEGTGERKRELAKKIFQRSLSEQSLKEQPTTSNQSEIETKKADIEKRRQSELDEFNSYNPDINNLLAKDRPNFSNYYTGFKEGVTEQYKANQVRKKINAKYDLEILNLNQSNSVNNIEFTHQIDGTEENKQVKEMESKIESKQLNLSEEEVNKITSLPEFVKLYESYAQSNNIREDALGDEDYVKIIESNYTREQINKICKN